MSFIPQFTITKKIAQTFTTNNPLEGDRVSVAVRIVDIVFNGVTRSIEVTCDDNRMRQCRIDRLVDDKAIKSLGNALQKAYDKALPVKFVAAGGNNPNVWFYTVI